MESLRVSHRQPFQLGPAREETDVHILQRDGGPGHRGPDLFNTGLDEGAQPQVKDHRTHQGHADQCKQSYFDKCVHDSPPSLTMRACPPFFRPLNPHQNPSETGTSNAPRPITGDHITRVVHPMRGTSATRTTARRGSDRAMTFASGGLSV